MNVCKSSPDQVVGCISEKGEGKFRGTTHGTCKSKLKQLVHDCLVITMMLCEGMFNMDIFLCCFFSIYHFFYVLVQYNFKDNSMKLIYEPKPRLRVIVSLVGEIVYKVACGSNHTGGYHFEIMIIRPCILLFLIIFILYIQWWWIRMALSTRE